MRRDFRSIAVSLAGCLLCFATASCGNAGSDPSVQRIVHPDGRVELRYPTSTVSSDDTVFADVRIGAIEGSGPTAFGSIRGIAVGEDGSIYVLDGQTSEVRTFRADGSHQATLSRAGQGPAEISRGHGIAISPNGDLWINDSGNRAIIGLSPQGREVGRHPLMVGGYAFYWTGSIDARGVFWERWAHSVERTPFDITATGPVEATHRTYYKSFDPATASYDSVEIGLDYGRGYRAAMAEGGQLSMGIPYSSGRLATIDAQSNIWTASSDDYAITRMNAEGDTLLVLRKEATAIPVTEEDLQVWREGASATFERAPRIQTDVEQLIPEYQPILTGLVTDDQGRLWVGRTVPQNELPLFDVYDTEGSFLGSIRLFPGMSGQVAPVIRDGRFYALVLGEFDEQYVVAGALPASLSGAGAP